MADYFSNFVEYFPRLMEGLKLTIIISDFWYSPGGGAWYYTLYFFYQQ